MFYVLIKKPCDFNWHMEAGPFPTEEESNNHIKKDITMAASKGFSYMTVKGIRTVKV